MGYLNNDGLNKVFTKLKTLIDVKQEAFNTCQISPVSSDDPMYIKFATLQGDCSGFLLFASDSSASAPQPASLGNDEVAPLSCSKSGIISYSIDYTNNTACIQWISSNYPGDANDGSTDDVYDTRYTVFYVYDTANQMAELYFNTHLGLYGQIPQTTSILNVPIAGASVALEPQTPVSILPSNAYGVSANSVFAYKSLKSSHADNAARIGTIYDGAYEIGDINKPVYFTNGIPTECTHTLDANVPADAKFTDTTYSVATSDADGLMSASDKVALDGKMNSTNPVGTGNFKLNCTSVKVENNSFSLGGTASGTKSCNFNDGSTASGDYSSVFGKDTRASGIGSAAFGYMSNATGEYSFAEGCQTEANGIHSHAEGYASIANNSVSHAEGFGTITTPYSNVVSGRTKYGQHVQGMYNIEDTEYAYIHIVGNGRNDTTGRSNAHTLDWDGNAWYAGDVYVGGTDQTTGSSKLATEAYVDNKEMPAHTHTKDDITSVNASAIEGVISSDNLPSYVDDVLEYSAYNSFPATGESGKIYVDTSTNLTYRWSGSTYVEISPSIALGETESTAYRGDRGKTAYEHATSDEGVQLASGLYKITTGAEGHVVAGTAATKADIGLGNVDNTTDASKSVLSAGKWTTARTLTIGNTGKSVDGSSAVSWSLSEIGAAASSHDHNSSYFQLAATNNATGNQWLKNSVIDGGDFTSSSILYGYSFGFKDKNDNTIGQIRTIQATNLLTEVEARRTVGSTTYYNYLRVGLSKSGEQMYQISSPGAFRSAIGITSGTAAPASSGTAGSIYIQYTA